MSSHQSSSGSQSRCGRCGEFITPQFARVFGNNDDEVYGCLSCQRTRDLREANHLKKEHKRIT